MKTRLSKLSQSLCVHISKIWSMRWTKSNLKSKHNQNKTGEREREKPENEPSHNKDDKHTLSQLSHVKKHKANDKYKNWNATSYVQTTWDYKQRTTAVTEQISFAATQHTCKERQQADTAAQHLWNESALQQSTHTLRHNTHTQETSDRDCKW